jgi:hypothetical protein
MIPSVEGSPSGTFDEVKKMKSKQKTIEQCVDKEELPARANLRVIRRNSLDYGLTADEIMDRNEHIRCHILRKFGLLLSISKQDPEDDFFIQDFEDSAFNTHDFQKTRDPFNKYAYAIRQIMEQVKDLAIMHSSISTAEGRWNTQKRYEALVDNKFRDRLMALVRRFKYTMDEERRFELKQEIQNS